MQRVAYLCVLALFAREERPPLEGELSLIPTLCFPKSYPRIQTRNSLLNRTLLFFVATRTKVHDNVNWGKAAFKNSAQLLQL